VIASHEWNFDPAVPLWILIPTAFVAATMITFFYGAQSKASPPRLIHILTAIRVFLVLLVVCVLLAPVRVSQFDTHSRGTLWLLIDDSASMRQVDRQMAGPELQQWATALGVRSESIAGLARGELTAALFKARPAHDDPTLGDVVEQYDVKIVPIGQPRVIVPEKGHIAATIADMLQTPAGNDTAIGDALSLVHADPKDDATVLVISDGRQNFGADPAVQAHRLAEHGVRVFTLAVGAHQPVRDAAVDFIDAPDSVFTGDQVTLSASLRLDGMDRAEHLTVKFRRDGNVIDQKTIQATQPRLAVEFTDKPDRDGAYQYEVAIQPLAGEENTNNNRQSVPITASHQKLSILLVDDEPRWEYQFLRNYLNRDRRFEVESVLLEPARIENIIPQPGAGLPRSKDAWSKFDVVSLGDIPPERLSRQQQIDLVAAVRDGKLKGLMLIAGPQNMPSRFAGAPLAEAFPVEATASGLNSEQLRRGYVPEPAMDSQLARFSADDDVNDELWSRMPAWFWHAGQTVARPGATVVWAIPGPATSRSLPNAAARHRALLATMRYGAGRVLYLASPETWRLRYVQRPGGQVEDLHRRFWGQAIRWASAGPGRDDVLKNVNVEDRNLNADPQRMAAIARAGNGTALDGPDFGRLASELPQTDHVGTAVFRIGLFDDPRNWRTRFAHWSALVAFVGLITAEWILRKRGGLV
jgi:hypothetical protein